MTTASILASLIAGGILSAFPHYFILAPASAAIVLALLAKAVVFGGSVPSVALAAILDIAALQGGFFLGATIRALWFSDEEPRPSRSPAPDRRAVVARGRMVAPIMTKRVAWRAARLRRGASGKKKPDRRRIAPAMAASARRKRRRRTNAGAAVAW